MRWLQRRALCGAAWLIAAILCTVCGACAIDAALSDLREGESRIACRYAGEQPAFDQVKPLRKRMAESENDNGASGRVAAWAQTRGVTAVSKDIGSSLTVDALWVDGEARLLWDWEPVRGEAPSFDTARICALDAGTALQLFGSTDVVGKRVEIDGYALTVACVFTSTQGLAAWGADPGRGLVLCPAGALDAPPTVQAMDFAVAPRDGKSAQEWVETWSNAAGLPEPERMSDLSVRQRLLKLAAQAPLLLLALCAAWPLLAAAIDLLRGTWIETHARWTDRLAPMSGGWSVLGKGLAGCAALTALAALALWLPRVVLDVPPDYLPTRWSDLAFWPDLARSIAQSRAAGRMTGALRSDMIRDALTSASWILSLAAVPLLWLARRALRQSARPEALPPHFAWLLAAVCAAPPLASLLARQAGLPSVAPAGLVPLALLFFAVPPLLGAFPPRKLLTISWRLWSPLEFWRINRQTWRPWIRKRKQKEAQEEPKAQNDEGKADEQLKMPEPSKTFKEVAS